MKILTIFIITVLAASNCWGQESKLELSSERKSDKSVDLLYKKGGSGYYTVVLNFSELTNASIDKTTYSIDGQEGKLLTLKPTDNNQSIGYRYSYRSVRGKLKPKIDYAFCYLFPYPPGTVCEVAEAGFASERYFGAEKPADWKSYVIYTGNEETVTAIRKGIVVEVTDQYEHSKDVEFTTKQNSIIIEHEDGSLVRYLGLKKGTMKVSPGDEVFPNTPLGFNTPRSKNRFGVSIFMYYLSSVDFESLRGQTLATQKSLYSIITPKFSVNNNQCVFLESKSSYTSYSSKEIITREMSKKELKRYNMQ